MPEFFPVAFVFFAAAILLMALPRGPIRAGLLLIAPLITLVVIWYLPEGNLWSVNLMGLDLDFMRVDRLSRIFGLIFCVAAFLGNLYAWHVKDSVQQIAALVYAGSAIGAVFAGDLITLFLFWEGTAITSVFLIWARGTEGAYHTGMRYLIIQITSGVLLLAGAVLFWRETGSLTFDKMTLGSFGTWLIFLAFGIKSAFPLLNNWLQDSYPAATITGSVVLSAFTTKLAIYALARGFPGTEALIYIGAVMTLFPLFFAVIENDLRRVLTYSLNTQLGFMVVGIGIGTELSLNGTAAYALAGILYKELLFMSIGAVLFRTGTSKASELGGLYKTMPQTMLFCVIGAASVSAFPLFSGFISKSLILSAASHDGYYVVWGILLFASIGVFLHTGIKVPYFAFFAKDSGLRPKEAPFHMLLAMGVTSFLCIFIGVFPGMLYGLLPFDVDYVPYTTTHVITQIQLLFFAALAFVVLMKSGIYPQVIKSVILDTDWSYRRALPAVLSYCAWVVATLWNRLLTFGLNRFQEITTGLYKSYGPEGRIARVWPTGSMVLWIAALLAAALLVNFF
ncbi:Na(+)/H(+) antiporter subunit D [Roseobacter sp. N2S]|uniref:Na(+)/H(+) antiporter subunit D n=1 Tax=Roseobacter sp. N2S TaxID=2663844 RepID=UPI00285679B1|nr:Na(+)/H(+) antiporter subunit D [Roseobacter sp. N2S]MDR6264452.1 multicomponent Na+:H+ antiporter subunit D [Roseobacter sp. N2S]